MTSKSNNIFSPRRHCLTALAAVVLICLVQITTVHAHELRPSIVDLNISNTTDGNSILSVQMLINLESLIAGIGPEHNDAETSVNASRYKQLRELDPSALLSEFNLFAAFFLSGIKISHDENQLVPLKIESVSIPPVGDIELPRDTTVIMQAFLAPDVEELSWQWRKSFGDVILRANSENAPLDYAALLTPGQHSEIIQLTEKTQQSAWHVFSNYIVIGFQHILPKGLDHILFVIGLFLLTISWRTLLAQVTVFTLAHSITLVLGISGVVNVSAAIVEPLIALSIVFICIENLFTKRLNKWRITTIFGFGLLHGLGFASVLGQVGLDNNNFIVALLGFNVGVELGQLTIIAACLLSVGIWFGKKPFYRRWVTRPASIVIGLIGCYWFFDRIPPNLFG